MSLDDSSDVDGSIEIRNEYPMTMVQSSVGIGNCTGFRRDILCAILRLGGSPDSHDSPKAPYGLAIKEELQQIYGVEVNHGRLYPNLDGLVDDGLVQKCEIDQRTNGYTLTETGVEHLEQYLTFVSEAVVPAGSPSEDQE